MDKEIWKNRIGQALTDMADIEFQRRAWMGHGPEISSFVEVVCGVFDDALISLYFKQYDDEISRDAHRLLNVLDNKVSEIDTESIRYREPQQIIDDPRWTVIRHIAQDLKMALSLGGDKQNGPIESETK